VRLGVRLLRFINRKKKLFTRKLCGNFSGGCFGHCGMDGGGRDGVAYATTIPSPTREGDYMSKRRRNAGEEMKTVRVVTGSASRPSK
jgi:hypothetical protein